MTILDKTGIGDILTLVSEDFDYKPIRVLVVAIATNPHYGMRGFFYSNNELFVIERGELNFKNLSFPNKRCEYPQYLCKILTPYLPIFREYMGDIPLPYVGLEKTDSYLVSALEMRY